MYESEQIKLKNLSTQINEDYVALKIDEQNQELSDLKDKQADPELYSDLDRMKKLNIEVKQKEDSVLPWIELKSSVEDLETLIEMAEEEQDESFREEIITNLNHIQKTSEKLQLLRMFTEDTDKNNCFLTLHSGAGGTEACDWTEMLFRMYTRWIEKNDFSYTVLDYIQGDEAGIKSVSLYVEGAFCYGYLKSENGVHRLVRISPFDSNKKRHTSFCSVFSTPEIDDDIEIEIEAKDLRVDTFRAGGAGGQHINTTDSAVRITHQPTGIVVSCQAERSQIQNREKAMKMLKARLYEKQMEEKRALLQDQEDNKKKIEWGSQIRSYVFHPYNMVKDHRTDFETGNVSAVMDGGIDDFITTWLKM